MYYNDIQYMHVHIAKENVFSAYKVQQVDIV